VCGAKQTSIKEERQKSMKRKLPLQKIKADIINGFDGKNGIDNRWTTGGGCSF